ncbi:hypothetical protein MNB_SV-6-369 [hydrothermal vent metagenome]|uniref:Uncharacterized protein n=1 Tax=hydrothermal vent metagenome TaxID=652676 RepID=A0A1W1C8W1_9ZZZZ
MDGMMRVTYTILCESDLYKEIDLQDILANEKVSKSIKSEFAKGLRNIVLSANDNAKDNNTKIIIKTQKEHFEFMVSKNDFADLLELAEDDARRNKRLKKGCDGVELIDIVTVE